MELIVRKTQDCKPGGSHGIPRPEGMTASIQWGGVEDGQSPNLSDIFINNLVRII